jgi:4-amino-4-deoxy-L-arabinose transferase-like glycosyltransferase
LTASLSPVQLSYRHFAIAVLIVLLALALRVIVTFDRARADAAFIPPGGTDQSSYLDLSRRFEAGRWPTDPFHHQPGVVYYLVGLRALVGKDYGMMALGTSLTGALSCGFMIGVGWLITRRVWGGYMTGLLLAIYPVTIFYSTVFLTEPLASFLTSVFLFFALWQRDKIALWRSAALGLTLGLIIVTRTNLAILFLAWLILLRMIAGNWRVFALNALVSFVFMALAIAPVTAWNIYAGDGDFQLVSSTGMDEVYRGNNRDATGVRSGDPAMDVVDDGYNSAFISDIRRDPRRFIELQLHKIGIYWSDREPINNVNYFASGEEVSPLLKAIPLDFRILSIFGLLGMLLLFYQDKRLGWFFLCINGFILAGVLALWVEGRLKQLAVVPLIATAGFFIVYTADVLRAQGFQPLLRRYAAPVAMLVALFVFSDWALAALPQKHPLSVLPADVRPLNITFGNTITLLGWRTLPEWPAPDRGWIEPRKSYVVELFWRLEKATENDYSVYVTLADGDQRIASRDRPIGEISYKPWPTSRWQPGEIYSEILGFKVRGDDLPLERSAEIRVGVYLAEGERGQRSRDYADVPPTNPALPNNYLVLERLAIFDVPRPLTNFDGLANAEVDFGGQLALKGYQLPDTAVPGETVIVSLGWQALTELDIDYTMFLHVIDENGEMVAQHDSQPRGNMLVTSTWPPGYAIRDDIALQMPNAPGQYQVYLGLYRPDTGERLTIDAPDNRWPLGEIVVE